MDLLRKSRWMLLALLLSLVPASSFAGVLISVGITPPVLPVYVQPPCPQPGWMWTPGYWAYGDEGYYWVPGAWVPAPYTGALWTPPYWGWSGGLYVFHGGYWGPHVGFYGGVNYGFGYGGIGFAGGEWRGREFAYNTAVVRVNTTVVRNTYVNETIVHNTTIVNNNRVSFNGGPGGINHEATPEERSAMHEQHMGATSVQQQHIQAARSDKSFYASNNGGHPQTMAAARPMGYNNNHAAQQNSYTNNHATVNGSAQNRPQYQQPQSHGNYQQPQNQSHSNPQHEQSKPQPQHEEKASKEHK